MLDSTTQKILGLIATLLIGIFVFALAGSISSGFAGFYGGLPFWIIVLFVMGLALYDFIEESFGISRNVGFIIKFGAVVLCGAALVYASWGASTMFEVGKDIRIRSLGTTENPYLVDGFWPKIFWFVTAFIFTLITFVISMSILQSSEKK